MSTGEQRSAVTPRTISLLPPLVRPLLLTSLGATWQVGRYAGNVDVGEGVRWSADRTTCWRLNDGKVVEEVSLETADRIARKIGKTRQGENAAGSGGAGGAGMGYSSKRAPSTHPPSLLPVAIHPPALSTARGHPPRGHPPTRPLYCPWPSTHPPSLLPVAIHPPALSRRRASSLCEASRLHGLHHLLVPLLAPLLVQ